MIHMFDKPELTDSHPPLSHRQKNLCLLLCYLIVEGSQKTGILVSSRIGRTKLAQQLEIPTTFKLLPILEYWVLYVQSKQSPSVPLARWPGALLRYWFFLSRINLFIKKYYINCVWNVPSKESISKQKR